jgi:hypothetical protein
VFRWFVWSKQWLRNPGTPDNVGSISQKFQTARNVLRDLARVVELCLNMVHKEDFELTCWPSDNSSHCKSAKEKYYKLCGHSRPGPAGAGVPFVTSRAHGLRLL